MAWTAAVGRSHFDYRAGAVFHDAGSLRERLNELADSGDDIGPRSATKVAFAYTGQGSQWVGMGRDLYESEPVAKAVLDRCEAVFREERGVSLLDVMFGRADGNEDLGDTAWGAACPLCAGVRPDRPLGECGHPSRRRLGT